MEAGREFDALIAEKVMGWNPYGSTSVLTWKTPNGIVTWEDTSYPSFRPSTRIQDAWLVVEKFEKDNWSFGIEITNKFIHSELVDRWECYFCDDDNSFEVDADTAPLAICLAALKAIEC